MKTFKLTLILLISLTITNTALFAQNPFVKHIFTADPTARVFEGKMYVYPSHDIPCGTGQGFIGFCMEDYHVFSSDDLVDWKDHGVILDQTEVPWVDSTSYSMWAPDAVKHNGKYYFYFPSISNENPSKRRIGIAVSEHPAGPFEPKPSFIEGVEGIDPNIFIDSSGQAYLYWARAEEIMMAKLDDNMLELASDPQLVQGLPDKFKEGPFLFERNDTYYMTFPHVPETTEQIVYAMADDPIGPFEYQGVIMEEWPNACWTNHHSIVNYRDQWYLFYHHNDLSPTFDKNRSIRIDSLFFNEDGTIREVEPTLRGVGVTRATDTIQIDRYTSISDEGAAIHFNDTIDKRDGWKVTFTKRQPWVRYNAVDFGAGDISKVSIKGRSISTGVVEIRIDSTGGPLLGSVKLQTGGEWQVVTRDLTQNTTRIRDLFVLPAERHPSFEIDWLRFE